MGWSLDITLIVLLAATLFQALRLERALGVLKRDRAELETLMAGFNSSTLQAEQGIDRLRQTADGAGRQIARQIEAATGLKDDLVFLHERGERLADRLDGLVRSADAAVQDRAPVRPAVMIAAAPGDSRQDVRSLRSHAAPDDNDGLDDEAAPRLRSKAERDLLKALRMVR